MTAAAIAAVPNTEFTVPKHTVEYDRKMARLRARLAMEPRSDSAAQAVPENIGILLANADNCCTHCEGLGLVWRYGRAARPCGCVYRQVFRACLAKYRYIEAHAHVTTVNWNRFDPKHCSRSLRMFARSHQDFAADVYLTAKRSLDADEWKLFRLHMIDYNNWRTCCCALHMDRGKFFHSVYRIEQKLGRLYLTMEPYALFPIDQYFS